MGDLRDELTALGRTMLARTNALADRVAALERRAGMVSAEEPEAPTPPSRADAALADAVSLAWSALDDVAERVPAGYAWLHEAVRDARGAMDKVADLLRAEAATADPPTVTPDAALGVMVAMDRGAEEDDPRPAQPSPPSPWRPLPDPAIRINERAWVTVADPALPGQRHTVAAVWAGNGIWSSSQGFFGDGLAWMPIPEEPPRPEPWRGGR